jgi:hypothetical protein
MKDWCVICNEIDLVETVARCVRIKNEWMSSRVPARGCSEVMKSGLLGRLKL